MGGKLIDYILASSSATPVLQPRKIKHGIFTNYYIDGGFLMDCLSKKLYKMVMKIFLLLIDLFTTNSWGIYERSKS